MSDPQSLAGQVAVITGGGTGLGRGIAAELAISGAHVVLASRKQANLDEGAEYIRGLGGSVSTAALDIRDAEAVQSVFGGLVTEFGRLDHLVNNAAGNFVVPAEDYTPNGFRTIVDIVL